jgi:hypothetical protein
MFPFKYGCCVKLRIVFYYFHFVKIVFYQLLVGEEHQQGREE